MENWRIKGLLSEAGYQISENYRQTMITKAAFLLARQRITEKRPGGGDARNFPAGG